MARRSRDGGIEALSHNADGTIPQAASRPAPLEGEPLRADDEHRPLRDHFIGGVGATIGRPQSARPRKRPLARPYILYHVHRVAGGYRIRPYSKDVEEFRPRRGQYGEGPKSVKKNAVIPAFFSFWVLRPQLWGS